MKIAIMGSGGVGGYFGARLAQGGCDVYFIARGESESLYVMFLSLVAITLSVWVVVAFFKLGGKSGHSMFHLFSYLCATEIIPVLITAKVLFQ